MQLPYKFKTKPYQYQLEAFNEGKDRLHYAYFMEMGTGKTKVTIDNLAYLYHCNKINFALVVAPNTVYQNWKRELDIHCPISTSVFTYKVDKIKNFAFDENKMNIFLMNVEAFSHKSGKTLANMLLGSYGHKGCMVIDESTTIKNRTAIRTKNIIALGRKAKYRRILTGSPVTKSPLDLFSQADFLGNDLLKCSDNFYVFQATYCILRKITNSTGRAFNLAVGFRDLDKLEKIVKSFSYRVRKKDCLDLPDKIYQKRIVQLGTKQRKIYDDFKENARIIIEDKTIEYNTKLTEIIKLLQVTAGFLKTEEGDIEEFENAKMKELLNVLEETEGKVIIWANWVHSLKMIIKELKKKYGNESVVAIYGEISSSEREKAVDEFQKNSETRFFVSNPQTGGYGLTLTEANTVIYFSNNYDLEQRQQSEDRAHRIGQENKVLYIDLVAEKTVDESVIRALNQKIKLSAETLGEDVLAYI
jgi:SNF2 family DNA or RNA helicase|tara:strand:- start:1837 stop:3255 length:1419 start_codon:yes stop_codon:yes gene_type:complete